MHPSVHTANIQQKRITCQASMPKVPVYCTRSAQAPSSGSSSLVCLEGATPCCHAAPRAAAAAAATPALSTLDFKVFYP